MPSELIKQLLEAGVHFGHQTKKWNPKMKKYIFTQRSGVYIIDLEKTVECLNAARDFLTDCASRGESVLFVATKKQAQEAVLKEAERCGAFSITHRWLGGLLTNFVTIRQRIARLNELERMKEKGTFDLLSKKEVSKLTKEMDKLKKNFSGIVKMDSLPKVIFIIDTKKEETAVREANRVGIPIVGLVDTNADPNEVRYPIPGNDDAMKSISLISGLIADSICEGRKKFLAYLSQEGVKIESKAPAAEAEVLAAPVKDGEEVEKLVVEELEVEGEELLREEPKGKAVKKAKIHEKDK